MRTCNRYKLLEREVIGYYTPETDLSFFNLLNPELLEENVDPSKEENRDLEIINIENLRFSRTDDKRLEDYHILSYMDLFNEYSLIRYKLSKLPKSVRDLVIKKYTEIQNFVNHE